MKKRNFIYKTVTIIFLFGLVFLWEEILLAQPGVGMGHGDDKGMHAPFFELLTDDQQAEIQSLVEAMREAGSDREAVREAVDAKLDEWGIERPEPPEGGGPGMHGGPFADLTEEQRTEIKTLVETLREAGSDLQAVREAVDAKLEEWGIERPEPPEGGGPGLHGGPFADLTEEQRTELETLVETLREAGSDRKAVREAVDAKLEEWGIERPEPPEDGGPGMHGGPFADLTEEQRTELETLVETLRESGSDREAVREAVNNKLEEWGIELPEPPEGGRHGGPGKHGMPFKDLLTDEQQAELETMVSSMRDADSSRDEIHEAIETKLEEWGIEIPEKPDQDIHDAMKELTTEQRKQVHELVKDMHEQGAEREEIQEAVKSLLESFGIEIGDSSESSESEIETQNHYGSTILAASNFPNPFNPETRISFELGKAARVQVSVYNVKGQLVNTLMDEYRNEGTCQVQWNGTLGNGDSAPSGMYFFKINAGGETLTERMLLMK